MRALKKTLIAAALVSAGLSSNAESNPPVYWPAMAMMPVQFGNQVVMIPVSGWITPRGFLPALVPQVGQTALANTPPAPGFFPGMPTPFPGMTAPPGGMAQLPPNLALRPGMPYSLPVPGQIPGQMPFPVAPQLVPGGTPAFAPGLYFPGTGMAAAPGMTMPAPLMPPIPAQTQRFPLPGFLPPPQGGHPFVAGAVGGVPPMGPGMTPGMYMGTAMEAVRALPAVPDPEPVAGMEPVPAVPVVTETSVKPQPESPAVQATASIAGTGVATADPPGKMPEPPALRTEAALVAVPVAAAALPAETLPHTGAGINDRDGDGVPNEVDLCPEKSGVDGSLGCPAEEGIRLGGIVFRYDSDELTEESKAILDRVAQKLVRIKGVKLEVAGHTDARGDAMYNLDLSERRARAVRDYLVEQGVSPSRLIAKGYGQTRPLADNESRDGRATNRRVELKPV